MFAFSIRGLSHACSTLKPCKGFLAISDSTVRQEVISHGNQKLDALMEVLASLNNVETQYLNLLLAQKGLESNQSILANKLVNIKGVCLHPLQHFYQKEWAYQQWKDTNLLSFILSTDKQEQSTKVDAEVIKQHYDVELTNLDVAQKIKIIKMLRELFGLGLKEAKDMADKLPSIIKKKMKREEAEKLKKDLEAIGCVITLK